MSTPTTPLTRESFLKLSTEELKKVVADPVRLAEVNAILNGSVELEPVVPVSETPMPTSDEAAAAAAVAQVEAARVAAEETARVEAAKAAAKAADDAIYKSAGLFVVTDDSGNITKITKTYQAVDEAGNPIGRPTYLEAKSWVELSVKQQAAHENAVRFAERVKKQRITRKKDEPTLVPTLNEAELLQLQEDLQSETRDMVAKAAERARQNSDLVRQRDANKAIEDARQAKESYTFLAKHVHDFNRCQANINLLADYIKDNNLEWTADNLDAALIATESQQAPLEPPVPVAPIVQPVPVNPAPAAPVVPVAPAPVVPPPAIVAPPAPPAAPNPPAPPAPRPGVNSGLVPGEQSASRPSGRPAGLTKADIAKMPREEYKRRLKDPKFVAEVNALRITHGLSQSALARR